MYAWRAQGLRRQRKQGTVLCRWCRSRRFEVASRFGTKGQRASSGDAPRSGGFDELVPLGQDLWAYDREIVLAGWLPFPARMIVLRGVTGALALLSPLPLNSTVRSALDRIGVVQTLIAPSLVHYLFLAEAARVYPAAQVLGPAGLERKQPGLKFEPLPERGRPLPDLPDLEVLHVRGVPYVEEHVFFHWPTRTLLLADLLFHVRQARRWRTRAFFAVMGAYGDARQSRIWRWLVRDRASFGCSLRSILDWPVERVVVAHGERLEGNARQQLEDAWHAFLRQ